MYFLGSQNDGLWREAVCRDDKVIMCSRSNYWYDDDLYQTIEVRIGSECRRRTVNKASCLQ